MDNMMKFVLEIQKFKMKELWNNKNDEKLEKELIQKEIIKKLNRSYG